MRNEPDNSDLVKHRCVELEPDLRAFLFGILRNLHDVEDALQRTILKAIQASSSVNPVTLKGWLFKIALNEARATKRAQRMARTKLEDWQKLFGRTDTSDEHLGLQQILSDEQKISLEAAINRLPPEQQEVLQRRIQKDQKFADIASEMNRPIGTILTWMRRALSSLKQMQGIQHLNPGSSPNDMSTDCPSITDTVDN